MLNPLAIVPAIAISLALFGLGCSRSAVPAGTEVTSDSSTLPPVTSTDTDGTGDLGGQKFILYTNRAIGYSILRPDDWYWRHSIANEIRSLNPSVDDYFVTDPKSLTGLGSEYLGQITIEVSRRSLEEFSDSVKGLTKTSGVVGGVPAMRYSGIRSLSSGEQKVIDYQFVSKDHTYRIMYANPASTERQERIFEQVVESFSWAQ